MIAIDPGQKGGIAFEKHGVIDAIKMPEGMTAQAGCLKELADIADCVCTMENVGGYMPGNSGPAAVTFGRHLGNLEAILYMCNVSVTLVTPSKWMNALGFSVNYYLPANYKELEKGEQKKVRAKAVTANKRAIKEAMARLYPHVKVTLATSDALGLMTYVMRK